jgi:hypothetical protein
VGGDVLARGLELPTAEGEGFGDGDAIFSPDFSLIEVVAPRAGRCTLSERFHSVDLLGDPGVEIHDAGSSAG